MPAEPLRIAWLGPVSGQEGGAQGVATELLDGLASLGHRIDCFPTSSGHVLPPRLAEAENLTFVWGTSTWRWDRWYSRTKLTAFASGLFARGMSALRLRREIVRRHRAAPYDVICQNSNIESLSVPVGLLRSVPLVIRPDTHIAGELRCLIAEREIAVRCQSPAAVLTVASIMAMRALVQRVRIRRASLVICISRAFRDHIVHDYGYPRGSTVVVANPVRLERFAGIEPAPADPPVILVLGRISVRKGLDDVVALARTLRARGSDARIRVVGGPSLWSDYTRLLDDLPPENSEYAGGVPAEQIPAELARSAMLLQASHYEPFGLTVAEALAAGVPVVATTEVGAVEDVDREVAAVVAPGDVEAMADAVEAMLARVRQQPQQTRARARAEAQRLFAPAVVCGQISDALARLVAGAALS